MHLAHYIPVRSGYCKYIFVGIFPLDVPISFELQFYTFHIEGGKRFDIRKHQIHTHTLHILLLKVGYTKQKHPS